MRRIVMFNRVTTDGYFAGPDGNLDWVVPDPEIDRQGADSTKDFDTVILGRRTYEMFESFWPHALDDETSAPNPHDERGRSPEMRAMAVFLNEATKLVFSNTLKDVSWKNSKLMHRIDPKEILALKKQRGRDMIVFGSGSVITQLTRDKLIDEYQFVVSPVILGEGKQLLSGGTINLGLTLQEARRYPSGNVVLRYTPK